MIIYLNQVPLKVISIVIVEAKAVKFYLDRTLDCIFYNCCSMYAL